MHNHSHSVSQSRSGGVYGMRVIVHTSLSDEMLAIEEFVDASKYGASTPVMLGEIGMVYGMRVIVHTSLSDEMIAWHPSAVGYAFSQAIELDFDKDLANIGTRYSLDYIFGAEVLDGGVRNVLVESTN